MATNYYRMNDNGVVCNLKNELFSANMQLLSIYNIYSQFGLLSCNSALNKKGMLLLKTNI